MNHARTNKATRAHSRRISAPDVIIAVGFLLTVLVLMFRPAPAAAVLPSYAWVFGTAQGDTEARKIAVKSLPMVTRDYSVVMKGDEEPTTLSFTGTPLVELLKQRGEIDVTKVPFVKLRFGDDANSDAAILLQPLTGVTDEGPPPMILDSGVKPGLGRWATPAIVPGQPGARPIGESSIVKFDPDAKIGVVPAPEGARIMSVSITKKKKSGGEWLLTANVTGSPGGDLTYRWFGSGANGEPTKKRFATTDATKERQKRAVRVVVTAEDGSTGTNAFNYTSRPPTDGATTDPGYGESRKDSGSGPTAPAQPSPFPAPVQPSQPANPGQPANPTPVQPTKPTKPTQPTEPTPKPPENAEPQTVDTSGVSDIAQRVNSTQPLKAVSGVLLAAPVAAAPTPGGGAAGPSAGLTPLQEAVASAASSIFQPVEDAGDLWPYMVALLFALGLSGAVREWINP